VGFVFFGFSEVEEFDFLGDCLVETFAAKALGL
jgi:hypothetical protein